MKSLFRLPVVLARVIFYLLQGPTFVSFFHALAQELGIAWAVLFGKTILNVVLIKPSKYDDETGYVLQDWRGILSSNTLATLYSMVKELKDNLRLGANIHLALRVYDETVQKVRPNRIIRHCQWFPTKTLVMLVGVQTNQFVRARDLALAFREKGIPVIMGGFHISGVLAKFPQDGSELNQQAFKQLGLQELVDHQVSLFAGEAEGRMSVVLQDFLEGRLKQIYNYLGQLPNLEHEKVPEVIPGARRYNAIPVYSAIESCRGCPFPCTFCTVRIVQGSKIRARGVQEFVDAVRKNWKKGIRTYFFTSDNSAYDPWWKERFDALILMREREGISITFSMQVDADCHRRLPGFVEKAAEAGCIHVFIGLETVNAANLKEVAKKQNRPEDYQEMITAFHKQGIIVHVGYMLGLPFDTKKSIAQDVQTLIKLGVDLVSFFMVVPLPGSDDHHRMFEKGEWMDPDLNTYDSFARPVAKHPLMSTLEWFQAYQDAWKTFYSVENLVRILHRTDPRFYQSRFKILSWYKYAMDVSERHPMISGFIRRRDRLSRRAGFPHLTRFQFLKYQFSEDYLAFQRFGLLAIDMAEVWVKTKGVELEQRWSNGSKEDYHALRLLRRGFKKRGWWIFFLALFTRAGIVMLRFLIEYLRGRKEKQ